MGLDMYLDRIQRYKGCTLADVRRVEYYFDYMERTDKYKNSTFKEWCGAEKVPPMDVIDFYQQYRGEKYYAWDADHLYPRKMIHEPVGYWRKENAIHRWFVDNVQDGEDDCEVHREVSEWDLKALSDACHTVLSNPDLVEELLPTSGGFFFGGTDFDEFYFDGLKNTIQIVENVLLTTDFTTQAIYYLSSW